MNTDQGRLYASLQEFEAAGWVILYSSYYDNVDEPLGPVVPLLPPDGPYTDAGPEWNYFYRDGFATVAST